jgi:hypothetical protein
MRPDAAALLWDARRAAQLVQHRPPLRISYSDSAPSAADAETKQLMRSCLRLLAQRRMRDLALFWDRLRFQPLEVGQLP